MGFFRPILAIEIVVFNQFLRLLYKKVLDRIPKTGDYQVGEKISPATF